MSEFYRPANSNPRRDEYDGELPAYGVSFLRERVFQVLGDGPAHAHRDQTQMLIVYRGRLLLNIGAGRHPLAAGDAIVVPVGVPHRLISAGTSDPLTLIDLRVFAGVQHDFCRLLEALPMAKRLVLARTELTQTAQELAAAANLTGWRRSSRLLAGLWRLVSALELAEAESPLVGETAVSDHRLRRAETFIQQNLGDDVGVQDIADAAGLSRSQLTRLYQQELGTSPAERLRHCRIDAARRLLAGGRMSVKEVARAVGFRWVHHFIRTYRTLRGHTPSLDLGVDE